MDKTMIARASSKRIVKCGVFGLLFLLAVGTARAERKGAEVSILRNDGTRVEGELVAVQGETLVLLAGGVDASIRLEEISSLAVHKRTKAVDGKARGDVFGLKAGAKTGDDPTEADQELGRRVLSRNATSTEAASNVLAALVWAVSDAKTSRDEVYLLKGIDTPKEKKEFLRHLNDLARDRSEARVKK